MIIPSIDLEQGRTVQLVGGEQLAIDAGNPLPLLKQFSLAGEVAVVDLDAAKGEGNNSDLMRELCRHGKVRVGGGIRDLETALSWLDAGAESLVIGTAASPELLRELPRERVIVALDARDGEVVTHGWRQGTGRGILERLEELRPLCGGFLVTFVEREGRLGGTDLERAKSVVEAAGDARVIIAGGVTTTEEVVALDRIGADAQVGMALYTGELDLAEAISAPLRSDRPDGFWPTVVVDEQGVALGLAYSSLESLRAAVDSRTGVYHSRDRGIWFKGQTTGATQELLAIDLDCDRDSLRFTVRQASPGFCHQRTRTCWGDDKGLGRLSRRLEAILTDAPEGSNTARLANDPELLSAKIIEEAQELVSAQSRAEVTHEAADLLYFTLVRAATSGVSLEDVERELGRRELRVRRRPCVAKEN